MEMTEVNSSTVFKTLNSHYKNPCNTTESRSSGFDICEDEGERISNSNKDESVSESGGRTSEEQDSNLVVLNPCGSKSLAFSTLDVKSGEEDRKVKERQPSIDFLLHFYNMREQSLSKVDCHQDGPSYTKAEGQIDGRPTLEVENEGKGSNDMRRVGITTNDIISKQSKNHTTRDEQMNVDNDNGFLSSDYDNETKKSSENITGSSRSELADSYKKDQGGDVKDLYSDNLELYVDSHDEESSYKDDHDNNNDNADDCSINDDNGNNNDNDGTENDNVNTDSNDDTNNDNDDTNNDDDGDDANNNDDGDDANNDDDDDANNDDNDDANNDDDDDANNDDDDDANNDDDDGANKDNTDNDDDDDANNDGDEANKDNTASDNDNTNNDDKDNNTNNDNNDSTNNDNDDKTNNDNEDSTNNGNDDNTNNDNDDNTNNDNDDNTNNDNDDNTNNDDDDKTNNHNDDNTNNDNDDNTNNHNDDNTNNDNDDKTYNDNDDNTNNDNDDNTNNDNDDNTNNDNDDNTNNDNDDNTNNDDNNTNNDDDNTNNDDDNTNNDDDNTNNDDENTNNDHDNTNENDGSTNDDNGNNNENNEDNLNNESSIASDCNEKSKSILEKFETYTTCSHCENFFTSTRVPKLLSCGHNICSACAQTENFSKCGYCNADITCDLSELYTNSSHLDLMKHIIDRRSRVDDEIEEYVGSMDPFYDLLTDTTTMDDERFLTPLHNYEKDLQVKLNFISFFLKFYMEEEEKLKQMEHKYKDKLNYLAKISNNVINCNSFKELGDTLEKLETDMVNTETVVDSTTLLCNRVLYLQQKVSEFLNKGKRKPSTLSDLKYMLQDGYFKCCIFTQVKGEEDDIFITKFAELSYDEAIYLHSFTNAIPSGCLFMLPFNDVRTSLLGEINVLFFDIANNVNVSYQSRIYGTFEGGKSDPVTLMFLGLKPKNICGITMVNNADYLFISKDQLEDEIFSKNFLKNIECETGNIEAGSILLTLADERGIRFLKRDTRVTGKGFYYVGRITSGLRDLRKIRENSYIHDCGLFFKSSSVSV